MSIQIQLQPRPILNYLGMTEAQTKTILLSNVALMELTLPLSQPCPHIPRAVLVGILCDIETVPQYEAQHIIIAFDPPIVLGFRDRLIPYPLVFYPYRFLLLLLRQLLLSMSTQPAPPTILRYDGRTTAQMKRALSQSAVQMV